MGRLTDVKQWSKKVKVVVIYPAIIKWKRYLKDWKESMFPENSKMACFYKKNYHNQSFHVNAFQIIIKDRLANNED